MHPLACLGTLNSFSAGVDIVVDQSSPLHLQIGTTRVTLVRGDITLQDTDAIVNAANSSLLGGGGVDRAIHNAGGSAILEECKSIRARLGECETGNAVVTTGGRLRAKYVIHAVGPIWHGGGKNEDVLLANAYRNSLLRAVERGVGSIAFPSISTGIYGFPAERASRIAVNTVRSFLSVKSGIREVRFVTYSQRDFDLYARLFRSYDQ